MKCFFVPWEKHITTCAILLKALYRIIQPVIHLLLVVAYSKVSLSILLNLLKDNCCICGLIFEVKLSSLLKNHLILHSKTWRQNSCVHPEKNIYCCLLILFIHLCTSANFFQ